MTDVPPPPPVPANPAGGGSQPVSNPLVTYWKLVVLERYAQFQGRSGRAEFWWYFLAAFIIGIVFNVLIAIANFFFIIYLLYGLAVLIPGIAVGVRRLHDTDKSGWWLLIGLIPIVGIIVLIVFWATEGTRGPNNYGVADTA
jgi:uncharacterized membrane protein YhaH (DUF805 family)